MQAITMHSLNHFLQSLVTAGWISHEQAGKTRQAVTEQKGSLSRFLLQQQWLSGRDLANALADYLKLPQIDLSTIDLSSLPLQLIDPKLIQEHEVLPISASKTQLQVAIFDLANMALLEEIKFHSSRHVAPVIVDYDQLAELLQQISREQHYTKMHAADPQQDISIIQLVQQIFNDAVRLRASDIHFEPYENYYRIRMRIDGLLHEILQPPRAYMNRITARLKILAKLDIAERRIPQDGRFTFHNSQHLTRDCRVSTCPTLFGEKIVVRLLDANTPTLSITELGLAMQQQQLLMDMIKKPQGMILVTGPTGSGKTVTLYSLLHLLNSIEKNISTVEDPVEIKIAGINQVHVNPKAGLTFAGALRSFLRQDPDIIMLGEIRDTETAEIAIKAAQTGHLVLSTVHTNSASETIIRLINMGIAPHHIASSVNLIIAQRLLRRLCSFCKTPLTLLEQKNLPSRLLENTVYQANSAACTQCTKGYQGRIGVYELLPVTPAIGNLMLKAEPIAINNYLQQQGMQDLRSSALEKVAAGITSLAEVDRVIN